MSEIIRVGGWALRGAGFPFGVAERGAKMLAWTEAVHGGAVQDIYAHEASIAESKRLKSAVPLKQADGAWEIDGAGRHLIEIGPPAVDLATSDARRLGKGSVRLRGTNGFIFAAALADLLAQRRLVGLLSYRAPDGDALPSSMARSGWIVCGRVDGRSLFAEGDVKDPATREIDHAIEAVSPAARPAADLAPSKARDEGVLDVIALAPEHDLAAALARLMTAGDPARLRDYSRRISDAYRDGVPMEAKDLQDLYDLEIRTWAPTSERSRSQAGYGKYSATAS